MSPTPPVVVSQTLRRRRGLTEQAAVAAVDQACRRLRLPTIRAVLDEALSVAGKEQLSYQGFLAELLLAECDDRDRRSSIRRVKSVGSLGISGLGTLISTLTRTSMKQQSTRWLKGTGSAKARRCVSSATQEPENPICSSG
ncbi:hypothetical protein ABIE35_001100 [Paenarthrobacter sp. 4246]